MRATRRHAHRAVATPRNRLTLLPLVLPSVDLDLYHLAWQGALHEDNFAVRAPGDALALEIQRFDGQPAEIRFTHPCHAESRTVNAREADAQDRLAGLGA